MCRQGTTIYTKDDRAQLDRSLQKAVRACGNATEPKVFGPSVKKLAKTLSVTTSHYSEEIEKCIVTFWETMATQGQSLPLRLPAFQALEGVKVTYEE